MLQLSDVALTTVHLIIIFFNLFGWIPKFTRKLHFVSIVLTAASWLLLGIWYGVGYCPFTDWQWQIKSRLGENHLPGNFIEYFVEKITGINFSSTSIDIIVAVFFAIAAILSLYVNFVLPKMKKL